jgi:H+/Cl- antiporter ClcA
MVGFLTGVTRTPFTSAILVLEMTDRHSVIFQLMLAAMLANLVALMIDKHSLYERLKQNFLAQAKEETAVERAARLQELKAGKQEGGARQEDLNEGAG